LAWIQRWMWLEAENGVGSLITPARTWDASRSMAADIYRRPGYASAMPANESRGCLGLFALTSRTRLRNER
jgi:hypothetical protein